MFRCLRVLLSLRPLTIDNKIRNGHQNHCHHCHHRQLHFGRTQCDWRSKQTLDQRSNCGQRWSQCIYISLGDELKRNQMTQ